MGIDLETGLSKGAFSLSLFSLQMSPKEVKRHNQVRVKVELYEKVSSIKFANDSIVLVHQ